MENQLPTCQAFRLFSQASVVLFEYLRIVWMYIQPCHFSWPRKRYKLYRSMFRDSMRLLTRTFLRSFLPAFLRSFLRPCTTNEQCLFPFVFLLAHRRFYWHLCDLLLCCFVALLRRVFRLWALYRVNKNKSRIARTWLRNGKISGRIYIASVTRRKKQYKNIRLKVNRII